MKLDYQFHDMALILGCLTVAALSLTALVTVLCRRRQARPMKPWLKTMLRGMAHADECRLNNGAHRLNPARLPIERL